LADVSGCLLRHAFGGRGKIATDWLKVWQQIERQGSSTEVGPDEGD
jgi:hypothetical protein